MYKKYLERKKKRKEQLFSSAKWGGRDFLVIQKESVTLYRKKEAGTF